jgi:outer membrane protein assembly factor BamB
MKRTGFGVSQYGLFVALLAGACLLFPAGCSKKPPQEHPDAGEEDLSKGNSPAVKWKLKVGRKYGARVRLGEGVVEIPCKIPSGRRESRWRQRIKRPKPIHNDVYVLDARTGHDLRNYTEKKDPDPTRFTVGGLAFTSSIDADSDSSWTLDVADSKTNKELWTMSLPTDLKDEPQIRGNTVYLQTQNDNLLAIDARTGRWLWEYPGGKYEIGKPWLFPEILCFKVSVYICPSCPCARPRSGSAEKDGPWLVGVDPKTGREVWKQAYPERSRLFATKRTLLVMSREKVYAVDFRNGKILWETEVPRWHSYDMSGRSDLLVDVLTFPTLDGYQRGFDARTGAERWRTWRGDLWKSTAVIEDADMYVSAEDGIIYALDTQTGSRRWSFNASAHLARPLIVEGNRLFATSVDGYLWVIDRTTGEEVWRFKNVRMSTSSRVAHLSERQMTKERIYLLTQDNRLCSLNRADGKQIWCFKTESAESLGNIVAGNGAVYFWSASGRLYCVDDDTGKVRWSR